jgi:Calcineurin-like phosphoesterase
MSTQFRADDLAQPQPKDRQVTTSFLWNVVKDKLRSKKQHHGGEKMVGWYNLTQLARTASEVVISSTLGRHNDRRLFQALENRGDKQAFFDFSVDHKFHEDVIGNYLPSHDGCEDLWFDYVSDLGDGWDPTYAIAHYLSQETLSIDGYSTERGKILIMGGDEVYPTATKEEYENRLEKPYCAAMQLPEPGNHPFLFAIPGNHDWYDSLMNFSRIFLNAEYFAKDQPDSTIKGKKIAGEDQEKSLGRWRVPQVRSYFALKLPHGWWLIGIDLQLDSSLDGGQIEYFKNAAKEMKNGDKIILCSPEPYWIYAEIYGDEDEYDSKHIENRLNKKFLEERVFTQYDSHGRITKKQQIALYLAGDLHHYYHVETVEKVHKITAGGGGAFLHPTHGPIEKAFEDASKYKQESKVAFPRSEESRKYTKLNWAFPFLNRTFGFLTMILYLLASWSVWAFMKINDPGLNLGLEASSGSEANNLIFDFLSFWAFALEKTLMVGLRTPVGALWGILFVGGFYLFTDTNSKNYRMYGSLRHGIIHVIAAFVINWTAYWLTVENANRWNLGWQYDTPKQILACGVLICVMSYLAGSFIFGGYLWSSLNVSGRHSNEAFSALGIQDWKNFLRLHINKEGYLTIYPIGIQRVPRQWEKIEFKNRESTYKPIDPEATEPCLIERQIIIEPPHIP